MRVWRSRQPKQSRKTRRVQFCPVQLVWKDGAVGAFMVDVSAEGAKLRSDRQQDAADIGAQEEVSMDIKTPYGPSKCRGRVQWVEHVDGGSRWGVRFTELPEVFLTSTNT